MSEKNKESCLAATGPARASSVGNCQEALPASRRVSEGTEVPPLPQDAQKHLEYPSEPSRRDEVGKVKATMAHLGLSRADLIGLLIEKYASAVTTDGCRLTTWTSTECAVWRPPTVLSMKRKRSETSADAFLRVISIAVGAGHYAISPSVDAAYPYCLTYNARRYTLSLK